MDPIFWQVIAALVIATLILGVVAWFVLRSRQGTGSRVDRKREPSARSDLQADVVSLRDRHDLLGERVERFERSNSELSDRMASLREDLESRLARHDALDQRIREVQEQIHEVRNEHKVLMERDERHERRVLELQDQLSEVRTEVHTTPGNGNRRR